MVLHNQTIQHNAVLLYIVDLKNTFQPHQMPLSSCSVQLHSWDVQLFPQVQIKVCVARLLSTSVSSSEHYDQEDVAVYIPVANP